MYLPQGLEFEVGMAVERNHVADCRSPITEQSCMDVPQACGPTVQEVHND